jgi:hypothetical protein
MVVTSMLVVVATSPVLSVLYVVTVFLQAAFYLLYLRKVGRGHTLSVFLSICLNIATPPQEHKVSNPDYEVWRLGHYRLC